MIEILKDINKKPEDILQKLCKSEETDNISKWIDEYNGKHKIFTLEDRQPEIVGEGENQRTVYKTKIMISMQKKITNVATAFMLGNPPRLILESGEEFEEVFQDLVDLWKDTKLDYFNRKVMRQCCIEIKVAELWNLYKKNDEIKIKPKLISRKTGYEIFDIWDEYGSLEIVVLKYERDNVQYRDIYTDEKIYNLTNKNDTDKWIVKENNNILGKIPLVLYVQDKPEWADVQTMIDRLEIMQSRHGDTNDYFGSPILKVWGELKNPPEKEKQGKTLYFKTNTTKDGKYDKGGDAEYAVWQNSPESIKLEFENLMTLIYDMTDTPDLSFTKAKALNNVAQRTAQLMFLGAITKAVNKQEIYGEGFDRRNNILKKILANRNVKKAKLYDDMRVGIEFQTILPDDWGELIENLITATGGKSVMSQESGVMFNTKIKDKQDEIKKIKKEKEDEFTGGTVRY